MASRTATASRGLRPVCTGRVAAAVKSTRVKVTNSKLVTCLMSVSVDLQSSIYTIHFRVQRSTA